MRTIIEILFLTTIIIGGIYIAFKYSKEKNSLIEKSFLIAFIVMITATANIIWIAIYSLLIPCMEKLFGKYGGVFKSLYDFGIILVLVILLIGFIARKIVNRFFYKSRIYYNNIFGMSLIITPIIYNLGIKYSELKVNEIVLICISLLLGKIIWFDSKLKDAKEGIIEIITFGNYKLCRIVYIWLILLIAATQIMDDIINNSEKTIIYMYIYASIIAIIIIIKEYIKKIKRKKEVKKYLVEDKVARVKRAIVLLDNFENILDQKKSFLMLDNKNIFDIIFREIYEAEIKEIYIIDNNQNISNNIENEILSIADKVSYMLDVKFVNLNKLIKSIKGEKEHEPVAIIDGCQLIDCEEGNVLKKLTDFYNDKGNYDKKSIVAIGKDNDEVIGRYIINPKKLRLLRDSIKKGDNYSKLKELLNDCSKEEEIIMLKVDGTRYNVANKLGFLKATIGYALKNELTKDELSKYLNSL